MSERLDERPRRPDRRERVVLEAELLDVRRRAHAHRQRALRQAQPVLRPEVGRVYAERHRLDVEHVAVPLGEPLDEREVGLLLARDAFELDRQIGRGRRDGDEAVLRVARDDARER